MTDLSRVCPKCAEILWHQVGEDDFGGDTPIPCDRLCCTNPACDFGWCETDDFEDVCRELAKS